MADQNWSDPGTWIGTGGLVAGLLAALKTVFDWQTDRRETKLDSEDRIREDLRAEIAAMRIENSALRHELAAARAEYAAFADDARRRLAQADERAARFQRELVQLRARMNAQEQRPQEGP